MSTLKEDLEPGSWTGHCIEVRGARQNNLRNVDVQFPHGQLVVVTGPSGSGKSSLAINTVFAEGQRQYIETLSTYARQFVTEMPRPDVDAIQGLQPTLCIDQHPSNKSPRSTVGTVTEIHDFLRVLMARAADIHCHECGSPIQQMPSQKIVANVLALPEGTKAMLLAPLVRERKGRHDDVLDQIRSAGLLRARIDGQFVEVDKPIGLNARQKHSIEAVTDRIVVRSGNAARITESVELALSLSGGACLVRFQDVQANPSEPEWREVVYSTRFSCPDCDVAYVDLEPNCFSFNSPYGACPECDGLGWTEQFDPEMILDMDRPVRNGAVVPWRPLASTTRRKRNELLAAFFLAETVTDATVLSEYREAVLQRLLYGNGKQWNGLLELLEKELVTCTAERRLDELEAFRSLVICPRCQGSRLGDQARSATLSGQSIIDINRAPLDNLLGFFSNLEFAESRQAIAEPLVRELATRLTYLCQVGLDYLTLDRPADTLSGGEYQRVRLASSIGNGLANVCYVLDEPTIGLHPADNQKLIDSILGLKQHGNTVVVVEHDAELMRHADWLVDMGPQAGKAGGQVVFEGDFESMLTDSNSATARFLSARDSIQRKGPIRTPDPTNQIVLRKAAGNNLKEIDVRIPLGLFVCVTGVSGSGKSTLVQETLAPAIRRQLGLSAPRPATLAGFEMPESLTGLVSVDQSPIGRSARSNAATYSGVMDPVRKLFAATRMAKAKGFGPSRFSFNSRSGMCPECEGHGQKKVELRFLPDLYTPCKDCRGKRFNEQTLEIRYRDQTIADVLEMSIQDASEFFANVASIHEPLRCLAETGLGYLKLGQPSTTLSGGEAQRVKLATEISKSGSAGKLFLLDEPTTGLHFQDVERLLLGIDRLVEAGNSVVVVEHNMQLVQCADWVIDLGPGAGQHGGEVVACGPPAVIADCSHSRTGKFLGSH